MSLQKIGGVKLSFAKALDEYPFFRDVTSPVSRHMLRPLDPRCRRVQFNKRLTDDDFEKLAKFLSRYPKVELRAYGSYDGSINDLEFLRFFPDLKRLSVDAIYQLGDISGLRHLGPGLRSLSLGQTKRKLSLRPLERFTQLRQLYLEGQNKDIDVVAGLTSLRSLTLRSITLPDLTLFSPLTQLEALDLKLGGTNNLTGIEVFTKLRYLELWMIRGFSDLTPVTTCTSLEMLFLQALKNVTQLPDLSPMTRLQRVHLETMKGLTDLSPLLTAPALEEVAVLDAGHMQPVDAAVLTRHPGLKRASVFMGSDRKNKAIQELLPLPRATYRGGDFLGDLAE